MFDGQTDYSKYAWPVVVIYNPRTVLFTIQSIGYNNNGTYTINIILKNANKITQLVVVTKTAFNFIIRVNIFYEYILLF